VICGLQAHFLVCSVIPDAALLLLTLLVLLTVIF